MIYRQVLEEVISRLDEIEELTVLFRRKNIDGTLPIAMIAPASFTITDDKGVTDLQGDFGFTVTLYADSFPDLLDLVEQIEEKIRLDADIPKTVSLKYKGFRVAQTESTTDNIEPAELQFTINLVRNLDE